MKQFTKYEAIALLGEIVQCKETYKRKLCLTGFDEIDIKEGLDHLEYVTEFEKGDRARVVLVEHHEDIDGIFISLLIDDDYVPFHKEAFECHCLLLQPVELSDAHFVQAVASVS